jgi:hypothetical protein
VSTPAVRVRGVFTRAEEEHDAMRIHEIDIQDYARQLLKHMVPMQLSRPRKKLALSKWKAKKKMPKFGGTSRQR